MSIFPGVRHSSLKHSNSLDTLKKSYGLLFTSFVNVSSKLGNSSMNISPSIRYLS